MFEITFESVPSYLSESSGRLVIDLFSVPYPKNYDVIHFYSINDAPIARVATILSNSVMNILLGIGGINAEVSNENIFICVIYIENIIQK
jgi:hypothetical protein